MNSSLMLIKENYFALTKGYRLKCQLSKAFIVVMQPLSSCLINPPFHEMSSSVNWSVQKLFLVFNFWNGEVCRQTALFYVLLWSKKSGGNKHLMLKFGKQLIKQRILCLISKFCDLFTSFYFILNLFCGVIEKCFLDVSRIFKSFPF